MSEVIQRTKGYHTSETETCDFGDGFGMRTVHFTTWVPPEITVRCTCGNIVYIQYSEESCEKCGRDFNIFGQELAPRHLWEEPYDEEEDLPGFTDADYEMRQWQMEG